MVRSVEITTSFANADERCQRFPGWLPPGDVTSRD